MPAYTTHGWEIPNSSENHPQPVRHISCGGPKNCLTCREDIAEWVIADPPKQLDRTDRVLKLIGYLIPVDSSEVPPAWIEEQQNKYDIWTVEQSRYNENTLFKVQRAFAVSGVSMEKTMEVITQMQNEGILFRERMP